MKRKTKKKYQKINRDGEEYRILVERKEITRAGRDCDA